MGGNSRRMESIAIGHPGIKSADNLMGLPADSVFLLIASRRALEEHGLTGTAQKLGSLMSRFS